MNSLNLRQIDGGNVIKQADFGSNLSFELLDERRRKIPELDGQTATIRLIKGDNIAYQTESLIVDSAVSFKFDRVLEKGIYVLEIVAGNYVFPSNNMVKITIEKTAGNYKPENMVKTDLVELQGKIIAIEQREHDVNQELLDVGQKQAEMTKRIEILEQKEDHDTIYDDTDVKVRLTALESKEDKDTVYDDTSIKQSISNVDTKVDNLSEKVKELEQRPIYEAYDDTELSSRVTALEQKEDKDTIYNDTEIKQSISNVDTKVDNLSEKVTALEERPIVDTALTERVEALERKEDKDTVYDDSAIVKRVEALEQKPDNDTVYNDADVRLLISNNKSDIDSLKTADTTLSNRIKSLEEKPDNDTIYDDSNLKAQIVELQEKLKSLNTVRRAPTGYTLDRTTTPWTVWFDNGCGMQMAEYSTAVTVYGYGFSASFTDNSITIYPIIPNIIRVSNGSLTIEKIKTIKGSADYWSSSIKIINPIRDRDDYDWANARFNPEALSTNHYSSVRQQYFIRTMYELGIWSGEIVEEFGATKK